MNLNARYSSTATEYHTRGVPISLVAQKLDLKQLKYMDVTNAVHQLIGENLRLFPKGSE